MEEKVNVFESENYNTWDKYLKDHENIADIERAKSIQEYEDLVFALVLRLFR